MKLKRLMIFAVAAGMLLTNGCQLDRIRPVPPFNRYGEYYFLTRNYSSSSLTFQLWGKALCNQDSGKFVILPSPSAIIPGVPLALVEHLVICPVIDTLFLPVDLVCSFVYSSESRIISNGFYVQVMDVYGRPVPDITIFCWPRLRYDCLPSLYDGAPTKHQVYFAKTDANGEVFVPVDADTCQYGQLNVSAHAKSAQGVYTLSHYERGYSCPPYKNTWYSPRPELMEAKKLSMDPDNVFPRHDGKNVVRYVLSPELMWDKKGQAHWKFLPDFAVRPEDDTEAAKKRFPSPIQIDEKYSPANIRGR